MNPYKLLKPTHVQKLDRNQISIYYNLSADAVKNIFKYISDGLLAVDIETKGVQAADPTTEIIGVGISNGDKNLYFPRTISEEAWQQLLIELSNPRFLLLGHNIFFDSAFLTRDNKAKWMNWTYCTYGLFRQLANEGFEGQTWGLKDAQINLLGWQDTNEWELDEWLIEHGYWKSPSKEPKTNYYRIETDKGERWVRPDKGEMYKAPAEILGHYCVLDAYSTYRLFTDVLRIAVMNLPVDEARKTFWNYHKEFIQQVRLHVYQQLRGIQVDSEQLDNHKQWLEVEIKKAGAEFLNHPQAEPYVRSWNERIAENYMEKQPAKFKIKKLGKEPEKLKKNGEVSKNWLRWKEKADQPPEISKNWLTWEKNYNKIKGENHFNINSGPQRQWLFYDMLKFPIKLRTDKGQPATDKKALLGFGDLGKVLKKQNDLVKELGYVQGCLDALIFNTLHPQFRMPGTLTCRLAGSGGVNIQQLPKSRGYLECYKPRPGMAWVDCDHTSLEQVVLAELSRDDTLLKLYGPDAKPNDVYLFNGSYLAGIGDKIRAAGYDPDRPTPEGIKAAKKKAKTARSVSKVVTLASSYGAGAGKIMETLNLQGIPLTFDEARKIHSDYWELYKGVKDYERYLLDEYRKRKGWVYNGIGRPVCIDSNYLKDIINRVVQATGHDVHIIWANRFYDLCQKKGLEVYGIVWDFHDQTVVECPEAQAEEVRLTFLEAYDILNQELKGLIPLSGDPQIISNLAEAKLED